MPGATLCPEAGAPVIGAPAETLAGSDDLNLGESAGCELNTVAPRVVSRDDSLQFLALRFLRHQFHDSGRVDVESLHFSSSRIFARSWESGTEVLRGGWERRNSEGSPEPSIPPRAISCSRGVAEWWGMRWAIGRPCSVTTRDSPFLIRLATFDIFWPRSGSPILFLSICHPARASRASPICCLVVSIVLQCGTLPGVGFLGPCYLAALVPTAVVFTDRGANL
jgi:hypothetical protein